MVTLLAPLIANIMDPTPVCSQGPGIEETTPIHGGIVASSGGRTSKRGTAPDRMAHVRGSVAATSRAPGLDLPSIPCVAGKSGSGITSQIQISLSTRTLS